MVIRVEAMNGQWKVYDAIVKKTSVSSIIIVKFDEVISSSSYEELVKRLRGKAA